MRHIDKNTDMGDQRLAQATRKAVTYEKRFRSAFKHLLKLGMSQNQIDTIFGLCKNMNALKKRDPELQVAYLEAMDTLEAQLAGHMVRQAIGYDFKEEKITYRIVKGKQVKIGKVVTKRHQPGNSAIMIHLTCNRFADRWKTSREVVTKKESYDSSPSERNTKQIESLARDILEADTNKPEGEHRLPAATSQLSG